MYIFYSIHYPHPHKVDLLVESMHKFGELMATQPGLIFYAPWPFYDPEEETVMGITVWESEEAFNAAMSAIADKRGPGPSPDWERQPTQAFRIHSAR